MNSPARRDPLLDRLQAGRLPPQASRPNVVALPLTQLRPGDIDMGELDTGGPLGISLAKLLAGRLLIQGTSGAGKSWTLRRLLEQTAGQVQQIVVDPEGDFRELAAKLDLLQLDAVKLDIATLAIAAARVREHRVSCVLDLSQLDIERQMSALTAFFTALVAAPREHWHPCLVAVDEAHLFAPFGGYSEVAAVRKAAITAFVDLMSRGRKRGLAGVLATQRIARLHKSVMSDVVNFMVGLNTLDLDIRRAAETIGWDSRKAFDRLPVLEPGEFVAVGPAFSRSPAQLRVGAVSTMHAGAAPDLVAPSALDPAAAAKILNLDQLLAESAKDQAELDARARAPSQRAVRAFIRDPAFTDAGRVWGALVKLAPDGTRIRSLASHLSRKPDQIVAAIALLDQYGAIEISGTGDDAAVCAAKDMLK